MWLLSPPMEMHAAIMSGLPVRRYGGIQAGLVEEDAESHST
jgi:hypothetical protein